MNKIEVGPLLFVLSSLRADQRVPVKDLRIASAKSHDSELARQEEAISRDEKDRRVQAARLQEGDRSRLTFRHVVFRLL